MKQIIIQLIITVTLALIGHLCGQDIMIPCGFGLIGGIMVGDKN